jgi:sec-independent protein translocase protein TatC
VSDWDQGEMTFTEHLKELRGRLIMCVTAVAVLAVGLFFPAPWIIHTLTSMYFPHITLHAFGPTDVIGAEFRFALFGAIVLSLPIIVYHIWMFAVPAINPRTRRQVYYYAAPTIVLAILGVLFCHFFILPRVVSALLSMTSELAEPTFGIGPTMNVILIMFLAFALIFQTPVVMVALARVGLVSATSLRKARRYTFMGTLLVGGVAAPDGSPFTMMLLAAPMYVLYEISIIVVAVLHKLTPGETPRILP